MDPITSYLKQESPPAAGSEGDVVVAEQEKQDTKQQQEGQDEYSEVEVIVETEGQERPSKRQKKNKNKRPLPVEANQKPNMPPGPKEPMASLKKGLRYILGSVDSQNFSPEVHAHAQELQKLLFLRPTTVDVNFKVENVAPLSPPPSSSQLQPDSQDNTSANPHTELPPPFALPDPKAFLQGPSPATSTLDRVAPPTFTFSPIPPKANFSTTTVPSAPDSNTLPALPPITDISLFNAPFTHTTALATYIPPTNTNSYEPLEFLGDAYLELIATRLIHSRFPLHTVGQKAGLREIMINNNTLAEYSKAYGFPSRIRTAESYQQHGPAWTKVLADVFEAYVACVVIQDPTQNGFDIAERWLADLWAPKILQWKNKGDGLKDTTHTHSGSSHPDAKADLNRLIGGKHIKIEYKEVRPMEMIMPGNRQNFFIGVFITGLGFEDRLLGNGEGRSKQIAGMAAATDALKNNQDIIQLANQKRNDADRQSKKKQGISNSMNRPKHQKQKRESNEQPINPHRGFV